MVQSLMWEPDPEDGLGRVRSRASPVSLVLDVTNILYTADWPGLKATSPATAFLILALTYVRQSSIGQTTGQCLAIAERRKVIFQRDRIFADIMDPENVIPRYWMLCMNSEICVWAEYQDRLERDWTAADPMDTERLFCIIGCCACRKPTF
jgi:hypothetical protein